MIMTKALVVAWGAVSAAATANECQNHTYHLPSDWNSGTVWPEAESLEVDSYGNLFLALEGKVWVCPMYGECKSVGSTWTAPRIVRVQDYPEMNLWNVWVVDGPVIKICPWDGGWEDADFQCGVYNNLFTNIRDMKYVEPYLFVVGDMNGRSGVWNCTQYDCDMFQSLDCMNCATKLVADFHKNIFFYDADAGSISIPGYSGVQFKCAVDGRCGHWTSEGSVVDIVAVGPDDSRYARGFSRGTSLRVMKRCSPDTGCEILGDADLFDRLHIDQNGVLYVNQPKVVWDGPFYHKALDLHRLCLPLLAKEMQV